MATLDDLKAAVEGGKRKEAVPLCQQAIDEGVDPQVILNDGLIAAMDVVGEKFSKNELFVPAMLMAAHDIGKNLVKMMLESKGFEMEDLGVDVPAQVFVDYLKDNPDVKLCCLSALLTTTMPAMADTVKAIQDAGLHDNVVVFVGGAPISQEFCDQIGADYYTRDAGECAAKAAEVV